MSSHRPSDGLQPNSDGLQRKSNGLQQPPAFAFLVFDSFSFFRRFGRFVCLFAPVRCVPASGWAFWTIQPLFSFAISTFKQSLITYASAISTRLQRPRPKPRQRQRSNQCCPKRPLILFNKAIDSFEIGEFDASKGQRRCKAGCSESGTLSWYYVEQ